MGLSIPLIATSIMYINTFVWQEQLEKRYFSPVAGGVKNIFAADLRRQTRIGQNIPSLETALRKRKTIIRWMCFAYPSYKRAPIVPGDFLLICSCKVLLYKPVVLKNGIENWLLRERVGGSEGFKENSYSG